MTAFRLSFKKFQKFKNNQQIMSIILQEFKQYDKKVWNKLNELLQNKEQLASVTVTEVEFNKIFQDDVFSECLGGTDIPLLLDINNNTLQRMDFFIEYDKVMFSCNGIQDEFDLADFPIHKQLVFIEKMSNQLVNSIANKQFMAFDSLSDTLKYIVNYDTLENYPHFKELCLKYCIQNTELFITLWQTQSDLRNKILFTFINDALYMDLHCSNLLTALDFTSDSENVKYLKSLVKAFNLAKLSPSICEELQYKINQLIKQNSDIENIEDYESYQLFKSYFPLSQQRDEMLDMGVFHICNEIKLLESIFDSNNKDLWNSTIINIESELHSVLPTIERPNFIFDLFKAIDENAILNIQDKNKLKVRFLSNFNSNWSYNYEFMKKLMQERATLGKSHYSVEAGLINIRWIADRLSLEDQKEILKYYPSSYKSNSNPVTNLFQKICSILSFKQNNDTSIDEQIINDMLCLSSDVFD